MIGNDVVDLTAAAQQSNWRRTGFLRKVFTDRERQVIFETGNQHQMVWLLWSMKEAAYKARQRTFSLPRILNWQSLDCRITTLSTKKATGTVENGHSRFFTATDLSSDVIHTTATPCANTTIKKVILEATSEATKRELLEFVAHYFSVSVSQLSITKDSFGVPAIAYQDKVLFDRFSFSDHGRFAAFSLSLRIS